MFFVIAFMDCNKIIQIQEINVIIDFHESKISMPSYPPFFLVWFKFFKLSMLIVNCRFNVNIVKPIKASLWQLYIWFVSN
jgi:hypothetical protein